MAATDEETIAGAFSRYVANNFDHEVEKLLAKLPPAQQAAVQRFLRMPGARDAAREHLRAEISKAAPMFSSLLEQVRGVMKTAAGTGQVQALTRLFAEGKVVPDAFEAPNWSVHQFPPNSVVLGDGVVFAIGPTGNTGALARFVKDYSALYVPISHERVLVGRRGVGGPLLDIGQVNLATAQVSLDTIFASQSTALEHELASQIGTGEPLVSEDELSSIASDVWIQLGHRQDA